MADSDTDSDTDDFQFASPQAYIPTFTSQPASPVPPLPPPLKPPSFAASPEDLPPSTSTPEPITQPALDSLSKILPSPLPSSASAAARSLSCLLRAPNSGAGDNPLCRWLYETFQTGDHLVVLRFVPLLAGVYLARASTQRRRLTGFEAVLLAVYSHRVSEPPATLSLPELSSGETPIPITPALEAQGSVRATRRAMIVGAALEAYYAKIGRMPVASKAEFCEFVGVWAGDFKEGDLEERIALPWELMQPVLKIVGHCMVGPGNDGGLRGRAREVCVKLRARALRDVDPKAILVIETLMKMVEEDGEGDYTEPPDNCLLSI